MQRIMRTRMIQGAVMSYRIDPAGEPFGDDDASIARALEEASIPCLMMSMIHMSVSVN